VTGEHQGSNVEYGKLDIICRECYYRVDCPEICSKCNEHEKFFACTFPYQKPKTKEKEENSMQHPTDLVCQKCEYKYDHDEVCKVCNGTHAKFREAPRYAPSNFESFTTKIETTHASDESALKFLSEYVCELRMRLRYFNTLKSVAQNNIRELDIEGQDLARIIMKVEKILSQAPPMSTTKYWKWDPIKGEMVCSETKP